MPNYGVRFYKIELFSANTRKSLAFQTGSDGKEWRYRDHLNTVLQAYQNKQVRGLPRSSDAAEESAEELREKPAVVLETSQLKGDILVAEYRVGRSEDFDRAYPAPDLGTDEFLELTGYAPARPYRAVLMVPHTGDVGMLAVETIGRACPYQFFVKWATRWSRDYQAELDAKQPLPDDKVRAWWRLRATPLGSKEQLMQYIKKGTIEELVLINTYVDSARDERHELFRVSARLHGPNVWARRNLSDVFEMTSDEEFAKRLASDFGHSVDQLDVDDGWISVRTDAGTKHVSPSRMPEIFTYPVSDSRPSMEIFLSEVKKRAIPLARALDAKIDFDSW
ncbi:hypothetical protein [Mycobacterium paraintracellulare]